MEKLTEKEEEIMRAIWSLNKAFVKEIKQELNTDLHYNTISTIIRNLQDKKYVGHKAFGNTHQYYPIIKKKAYQKEILSQTTAKFFEGSYKDLVSFFAKEEKISQQELEDIIKLIQSK